MRTALRLLGVAMLGTALVGVKGPAAPVAVAAGQVWNGKYSLLRYAGEKTGTSLAARQPEPGFSDVYTFVTDCSRDCVSTVVDGPRPANPTLPLPPRYTWNGSTWVHIYEWQWDCYLGEGVPKAWKPARSVAYYTPQPDGTLRGSWRTDIYGGPCDGSVVMDVAAFPPADASVVSAGAINVDVHRRETWSPSGHVGVVDVGDVALRKRSLD